MKIDVDELKNLYGEIVDEGYRLVYIHDNEYQISSYSKTIEGFICELNDYNPYSFEEEVEFTSVEQLLKDISEKYDEDEVYIYDVNGNVISYYNKKNKIK